MDTPFHALPAGRDVLIESAEPFSLHFGFDGWQKRSDRRADQTRFGMQSVRLVSTELRAAATLDFTLFYPDRDAWRGCGFEIDLDRNS